MQSNLVAGSAQAPYIKGPCFESSMCRGGGIRLYFSNVSVKMWGEQRQPIVGAKITKLSKVTGDLIAEDGSAIGSLVITPLKKFYGFVL